MRAQRSTTVSFMDAKTDLSLMYDSLEWDEAFMILGLRNHRLKKDMVGQVSVAHLQRPCCVGSGMIFERPEGIGMMVCACGLALFLLAVLVLVVLVLVFFCEVR